MARAKAREYTYRHWEVETDPTVMQVLLQEKITPNKGRLLACAACRIMWDYIQGSELKTAVEMVEGFTDGKYSKSQLAKYHAKMDKIVNDWRNYSPPTAIAITSRLDDQVARVYQHSWRNLMDRNIDCTTYVDLEDYYATQKEKFQPLSLKLADATRDIFGNPYLKIEEGNWKSSLAIEMAEEINTKGVYNRMPILGDALEDAGCGDKRVLDHCRSDKVKHFKGCWVISHILGKE